jgi:hypothetical protein
MYTSRRELIKGLGAGAAAVALATRPGQAQETTGQGAGGRMKIIDIHATSTAWLF